MLDFNPREAVLLAKAFNGKIKESDLKKPTYKMEMYVDRLVILHRHPRNRKDNRCA
jgi:hypothetical protein